MHAKFVTDTRSFLKSLPSDPQRLFWVFALTHLVLWTLIPCLVSPNAPLDVIEGYAWGHEWQWGTNKHPPMQAWLLEITAILTGRSDWGHFLISQIAVVTAFWAVWQMGCRIMNEKAALVSVLLLEGIIYYNYTSPEFNPNLLQLPFWALIGLFFHRSVKDNRLMDWALLGFWSACGLYTKYSTGLLLAVFALLFLAHPVSRKRLKEKGPYLSILVTALLFLPHIIWLIDNQFAPFEYIMTRIESPNRKAFHFAQPGQLVLSQLLAILPMIFMLPFIVKKKIFLPLKLVKLPSFDRAFLNTIVFGPFLILLIISLAGVKVRDMWATPLWGYIGLWVVNYMDITLSQKSLKRLSYAWVSIFLLGLFSYGIVNAVLPYLNHKVQRVHFPGEAFAMRVNEGWHSRYQDPLRFVIGDVWPSGNIAFYGPDRPHVLIKGDYKSSPWINPADIKKYGGIITWCIKNCACHNYEESIPNFVADYPEAEKQQPITFNRQTGANVEPVTIGWAILPPRGATNSLNLSERIDE